MSILLEPYTPDTHMQNGGAEHFGWLIMEKAQIMRLSTNLLHKLQKKMIAATMYLYNQTLYTSNNWKSPYKLFYTYVFNKEEVTGPKKPNFTI